MVDKPARLSAANRLWIRSGAVRVGARRDQSLLGQSPLDECKNVLPTVFAMAAKELVTTHLKKHPCKVENGGVASCPENSRLSTLWRPMQRRWRRLRRGILSKQRKRL